MVCVCARVESDRHFFQPLVFGLPACLIFCLLSTISSFGQERCGTVEYDKMIHGNLPSQEREARFEQWVRNKIIVNGTRTLQANRLQSSTYVIPVVVHVIHNGESLGTGTNISDAQIASQIQ